MAIRATRLAIRAARTTPQQQHSFSARAGSTYLVTGGNGCIGAWVVKLLLERGDRPVIFDAGGDTRRISALLENPSDIDAVEVIQGDIRSAEVVAKAVRDSGAERIVHLAGHQIPLCREEPAVGGAVNVIGTLNVFEAARVCGISQVAYASSAAVYGPDDCNADDGEGAKGPPREVDPANPTTHYGVFKLANEGNARVYFADCGISSVGLRPLTVYGVGRDFGMTSDPTRAMKAAVAGRPFEIRFRGSTDFQYVKDCALTFIASADESLCPPGAHVFNLQGDSVDVEDVLGHVAAEMGWSSSSSQSSSSSSSPPPSAAASVGQLSITGGALPIPPRMDGSLLVEVLPPALVPPKTGLADGIKETVAMFKHLQAQGRLDTRELDE